MRNYRAPYGTLPELVMTSDLYDGDVIKDEHGRFCTIYQAWHGKNGVEMQMVTGAIDFEEGTATASTRSEVFVGLVGVSQVLLCGIFRDGIGVFVEDPRWGGMRELFWTSEVHNGEFAILDDGLPYYVHNAHGELYFRALSRTLRPIYDCTSVAKYLAATDGYGSLARAGASHVR